MNCSARGDQFREARPVSAAHAPAGAPTGRRSMRRSYRVLTGPRLRPRPRQRGWSDTRRPTPLGTTAPDRHQQQAVAEHEQAVDPFEGQAGMVVDPQDQDRGEAEDEREVGRPLMQDDADEVAGRDLVELWNRQIQGQDRDRDRDRDREDPVAARTCYAPGRVRPPSPRQLAVRGSSWPTWASRGSSAPSSRPASVRLIVSSQGGSRSRQPPRS
jgi:hypothetical protein